MNSKLNRIAAFILLGFFTIASASAKDGYNITIKISGMKNTMILMGYYYGDKQYIKDSAVCDVTGKAVFKGKENLDGGIYLIASTDRKLLFDFVVSEPEFTLETDTTDYINKMVVKGSPENEAFFNYSKFTAKCGREAMELDKKSKAAKEKKDTAAVNAFNTRIREIDSSVDEYRKNVIKTSPDKLIAKIFRMMQEIDVPEAPTLPNGRKDSLFSYYYYRSAYLNNIDFQDDRLVRTPVFFTRIQTYITRMVPQIPDSIAAAAFDICDRAMGQKEMQKWLIYWITNHYETSEYMGMDAVFVKMADKYYRNKALTPWLEETLRFKITDRADQLRYTLLGARPINLNLPDSGMNYHALYNIKADYTTVLFWDPHCGRCKEEIPKLLTMYKKLNGTGTNLKSQKRVEIYGLGSTTDYPAWRKYLAENKLPWINVHDPKHESNYHRYFDIYSTPVIYLLNKDKKVVAKRLSVEQLEDFIEKGIE